MPSIDSQHLPARSSSKRRSVPATTAAVATATAAAAAASLVPGAAALPTEQKSWILSLDANTTDTQMTGIRSLYRDSGLSLQSADDPRLEVVQIGDFRAMIAPAGDAEFKQQMAGTAGIAGIETQQTWQLYTPTPWPQLGRVGGGSAGGQAGRGGGAGGQAGGADGGAKRGAGAAAGGAVNPAAELNKDPSAQSAGKGVTVFVIDTGIDVNHPAFANGGGGAGNAGTGQAAGQDRQAGTGQARSNGQQAGAGQAGKGQTVGGGQQQRAGGGRRLQQRQARGGAGGGNGRTGGAGGGAANGNTRAQLIDLTGSGGGDQNGHGTHVAGTAAGQEFGIARSASIMAIKVFDASGKTQNGLVLKALQEVSKRTGDGQPAVVNMSLGGRRAGGQSDSATQRAIQELTKRNVAVVVAAGNEGQDACNTSPAFVPEAITVAASDQNGQLAKFSNTGRCTTVIAPGDKVLSAAPGGGKKVLSGTSMASPVVAGTMAALMGNGLSATEARAQLEQRLATGKVQGAKGQTPTRALTPDAIKSAVDGSAGGQAGQGSQGSTGGTGGAQAGQGGGLGGAGNAGKAGNADAGTGGSTAARGQAGGGQQVVGGTTGGVQQRQRQGVPKGTV